MAGRGRRSGTTETSAAILDAARMIFAESGYEGATIRRIAAQAGVDPALVHHFFGSKERLFIDAMRLPVAPSDAVKSASSHGRKAGHELVRSLMTAWDDPRARAPAVALLRTAVTNDHAAQMLREFVAEAVMPVVTAIAEPDEAPLRASLVASQIVGLAFARFILELAPIATATPEQLARTVGPTVQRYLTGRLS